MNLFEMLVNDNKFFLIAGPCVIENEKIILQVAEKLKKETLKRDIIFIFKSSYKKANRSSMHSFSGVGLEEGLRILKKVKREFDISILTDVHETNEINPVAKVVDIIQIPAFLSRQTDLIVATAKTGKIVNIKKGQFLAPEDMKLIVEKVTSQNNEQILLTERGTCFGYHNLVVDFRSFDIMKKLGYSVVYDVTHSLQKPTSDKTTGGTPQYALMMAKAALATGKVDGLFIETHPNPKKALSDAATMLPLDDIPKFLDECLKIKEIS